jgi:hypothetical protein
MAERRASISRTTEVCETLHLMNVPTIRFRPLASIGRNLTKIFVTKVSSPKRQKLKQAASVFEEYAQLKLLQQIVEENKELLLEQWDVFKRGGNIKIIKINK